MAVALARQGKSVGLLRTPTCGDTRAPQLFGVRRSPIAMYETMFPVQAHGVRLMSLGFLVEEEEPIVWRGPMLHKALTQFVHDVHGGPLDVLLLDLPPGTGDVTLSVLELLPEASLLVVTTPQQAARTVASRVGAMARDVGMPVSGVVENMSELICPHCAGHSALFGTGGGQRLAGELGAPLLGQGAFGRRAARGRRQRHPRGCRRSGQSVGTGAGRRRSDDATGPSAACRSCARSPTRRLVTRPPCGRLP